MTATVLDLLRDKSNRRRYLTLKGIPPSHGSDQKRVFTSLPTLLTTPFANHP
ncbi:hypothetical protein A2U01_0100689, partial [Trifolium medium]|nr:hypothetical protein [Trifolium medium]